MKRLFFFLLLSVSGFAQTLDIYGGLTGQPAAGGATGKFYLEKRASDGHWLFGDPVGNYYYYLGIQVFDKIDAGACATNANCVSGGSGWFSARYSGNNATYVTHQLQRANKWKFTGIGAYATSYALPVQSNTATSFGQCIQIGPASIQLPYMRVIKLDQALDNTGHQMKNASKLLWNGITGSAYAAIGIGGTTFNDVFDPNWQAHINSRIFQNFNDASNATVSSGCVGGCPASPYAVPGLPPGRQNTSGGGAISPNQTFPTAVGTTPGGTLGDQQLYYTIQYHFPDGTVTASSVEGSKIVVAGNLLTIASPSASTQIINSSSQTADGWTIAVGNSQGLEYTQSIGVIPISTGYTEPAGGLSPITVAITSSVRNAGGDTVTALVGSTANLATGYAIKIAGNSDGSFDTKASLITVVDATHFSYKSWGTGNRTSTGGTASNLQPSYTYCGYISGGVAETPNTPQPQLSTTPWLIATLLGDSDFWFGLGPRPGSPYSHFPSNDGNVHPHVGILTAAMSPIQINYTNSAWRTTDGTTAPVAATLTTSGTGGSLADGTYCFGMDALNDISATKLSTETCTTLAFGTGTSKITVTNPPNATGTAPHNSTAYGMWIGTVAGQKYYQTPSSANCTQAASLRGIACALGSQYVLTSAPSTSGLLQSTANNFAEFLYADNIVYSKQAWKNFLVDKYGNIGALNTAWGSSYTTFDSSTSDYSGWPKASALGTGLMDEDGSSAWMGTDAYLQCQENLSCTGTAGTANATVAADADAFAYLLFKQGYSLMAAAARGATPGKLVGSSDPLNGHNGLSRTPVLKAIGEQVDLLEVSSGRGAYNYADATYSITGKPMFLYILDHDLADSPVPNQTANTGNFYFAHNNPEKGQNYDVMMFGSCDPNGANPITTGCAGHAAPAHSGNFGLSCGTAENPSCDNVHTGYFGPAGFNRKMVASASVNGDCNVPGGTNRCDNSYPIVGEDFWEWNGKITGGECSDFGLIDVYDNAEDGIENTVVSSVDSFGVSVGAEPNPGNVLNSCANVNVTPTTEYTHNGQLGYGDAVTQTSQTNANILNAIPGINCQVGGATFNGQVQ